MSMPQYGGKRAFRMALGWPAVVAMAASCFVLQPGTLGADDRSIFSFTSAMLQAHFRRSVFNTLIGAHAPTNVLNHDYAAFLLQLVVYLPYWLLSHVLHGLSSPVLTQAFMAMMFNLPIWICIWVGWKLLRARHVGEACCFLALVGIFAGSYATSALAGNPLNSVEALVILLQLLLVSREHTAANTVILGLLGGYLVALRPYDAVDALVLLALFLRGEHRLSRRLLYWGVGFAAAMAVGFGSKFLLHVPTRDYAGAIDPALGSAAFLPTYLARWRDALFSFAYGIPWTMPFLVFALASPDKSALPLKLAAILAILAFTTLFPFWPGNSEIAGNRYLLAQLFLLLPEAGLGFQRLVQRHHLVALVVPVLVLLFLPSIAFRHNLTFDYAVGEPTMAVEHPVVGHPIGPLQGPVDMPLWNPLFHPAVFAWWQTYALATHEPMILPAGSSKVSLDPKLVPPYGLLPRLVYITTVNGASLPDGRVISAQQFVAHVPRWVFDLIYALATLAALFWLTLLGQALYIIFAEPPPAVNDQHPAT